MVRNIAPYMAIDYFSANTAKISITLVTLAHFSHFTL